MTARAVGLFTPHHHKYVSNVSCATLRLLRRHQAIGTLQLHYNGEGPVSYVPCILNQNIGSSRLRSALASQAVRALSNLFRVTTLRKVGVTVPFADEEAEAQRREAASSLRLPRQPLQGPISTSAWLTRLPVSHPPIRPPAERPSQTSAPASQSPRAFLVRRW